jgi:hypothetical protein
MLPDRKEEYVLPTGHFAVEFFMYSLPLEIVNAAIGRGNLTTTTTTQKEDTKDSKKDDGQKQKDESEKEKKDKRVPMTCVVGALPRMFCGNCYKELVARAADQEVQMHEVLLPKDDTSLTQEQKENKEAALPKLTQV